MAVNEFIITFRESLEAALVVGIVGAFVSNSGEKSNFRFVLYGILAAVVCSILAAVALESAEELLQYHSAEYFFEAAMMFLASGFLIYMVSWMAKRSNIRQELEQKTSTALETGSKWGIFSIVFFAIMREGFETVLFLFASENQTKSFSYVGAITGIIAAVLIAWLIFSQSKRLPIKQFFNITSILLIVMAAGMAAYGTHELEEGFEKAKMLGLFGLHDETLPDGKVIEAEDKIARPWDILKPQSELSPNSNPTFYTQTSGKHIHWFHDKGLIGSYLKGFIGYNSNPNWPEFFIWIFTLGFGIYLWKKPVLKP